jgi:hypothetical protein
MTAATHTLVQILASCLLVACILFGFGAGMAVASEITGTLSSDGSTDQDTNAAPITDQNENARTLSGTVVGGVNDSTGDFAALETILWPVSLALLFMLGVYFLHFRRSV